MAQQHRAEQRVQEQQHESGDQADRLADQDDHVELRERDDDEDQDEQEHGQEGYSGIRSGKSEP